jgi:hypothetical protein
MVETHSMVSSNNCREALDSVWYVIQKWTEHDNFFKKVVWTVQKSFFVPYKVVLVEKVLST